MDPRHADLPPYDDGDESVAPVRSGSFRIVDTELPVAGEHYPRDPAELEVMFHDEAGCRTYLERLRWPRGFRCVHCASGATPWRSGTGLLGCSECGEIVAATHGTLFHGSTVPLQRWFRAMWVLTDHENGASAGTLRGVLGLNDARSAADCLAMLRGAMGTATRQRLASPVLLARSYVEVDGPVQGGRRATVKAPIVVAVEKDRGRLARVRMRYTRTVSPADVARFVREAVEPGAEIYTGRWDGYRLIERFGYRHCGSVETSARLNPDPGQVISLLRLWLWTTGEARVEELPALLDELAFRFDRRTYPRGLLFYKLMILAVHPDDEPDADVARTA